MRYVYGINPALAVLRKHPEQVERVFIAQGARQSAMQEIVARARESGVRVDLADRDRLGTLSDGGVHQGVVVEVREYEYAEPEDLVAAARAANEAPLLVVLDGIQDPQNLGAIIRSALAFGAHGAVIAKDRATGVTGTVAKASAGAVEHLRVARVTNLAQSLAALKKDGLWIAAATPQGESLPSQVDLTGPMALVIGAEGVGIRRLVLEQADFRVRIPIRAAAGSLNASAAAAVMLYEASRQRQAAGTGAKPPKTHGNLS